MVTPHLFFNALGCCLWFWVWIGTASGAKPSSPPTTSGSHSTSLPSRGISSTPLQQTPATTPQQPTHVDVPLTFLFTSDLGGRLRNFSCSKQPIETSDSQIDMANMLWRVQQIHRELRIQKKPRPFLFNTGDNLAPQQEVRFMLQLEGVSGLFFVAEVFRRFRYDLIGLGNHEFSIPPQRLRLFLQRAQLYGLQFAASNITKIAKNHELSGVINREKDTQQYRPYFIFTTHAYRGIQVRVAAFHLIKKDMSVDSKRLKGLTIEDPYTYARKMVEEIRKQKPAVDFIVALSHLESRNSQGKHVIRLAKEVPGIDLILTNELHSYDQHLHGSTYVDTEGRRVHIVGGVPRGKMIGRIDVTIRKHQKKPTEIRSVNIRGIPLQQKQYHYNLRHLLVVWEKAYCRSWGRPLGQGKIRTNQSMQYEQFTTYLLNLMRHHTQAEIAVINEGAIRRSPFPIQHFITQDDLYRAMLFDSKLVYLTARGETLQQWLNPTATQQEKMYTTGWTGGQVNGRTLASQKTYSIVTIDFVLQLWRNALLASIEQQKELKQSAKKQMELIQQQQQQQSELMAAIRQGRTQYPSQYLAEKQQIEQAVIKRQQRTHPPLNQADQTWITQQYAKLGNLFQKIQNAESYHQRKLQDIQQQIEVLKKKIDNMRQKGTSVVEELRDIQEKQRDYTRTAEELQRVKKQNLSHEEQFESSMKNWVSLKKMIQDQLIRSKSERIRLEGELKKFDQRWHIITYRGCPKVSLSDHCSSRCCPRLRTLALRHFTHNEFRVMGPLRPPKLSTWSQDKKKEPKPFGPNEIPHTGNLVELEKRFAWDLDVNFSLRVDVNYVSPDNLIGALSYFRVTSEYFRQFQIAGDLKVQVNAGTLYHQWTNIAQIQYGAYIRAQYDQSKTPPLVDEVFDEANDRVQISTQYQFRRWRWFKPLARFELDTELTRNRRPNLTDEKFFEKLSQYRYRHLSLEGEVGFEIEAIENYLTFKIGISYKREFAPELFPIPGTPEAQKYPFLGGFPDTNGQPGLSFSYETGLIRMFTIGRNPSTFQSRGKYSAFLSIPAPGLLVGQQVLLVHDIELTNTLSFGLTENVSLSLELKTIIYRGTLQKPISFGNSNPLLRIEGPWAFWITPTVSLSVRWGTRGQYF